MNTFELSLVVVAVIGFALWRGASSGGEISRARTQALLGAAEGTELMMRDERTMNPAS